MGDDVGRRRTAALLRLHHGGDRLPEALIRHPHHSRVGDVGMPAKDDLHFFRKDLLATVY